MRAEAASPSGGRIAGWLDRTRDHRDPETLASARLLVAPASRLFEESERGPDGWDVASRRIAAAEALPETVGVDAITSALIAGCDGQLSLATIAELLSAASGVEPAQVHRVAAHLVETGHLTIP